MADVAKWERENIDSIAYIYGISLWRRIFCPNRTGCSINDAFPARNRFFTVKWHLLMADFFPWSRTIRFWPIGSLNSRFFTFFSSHGKRAFGANEPIACRYSWDNCLQRRVPVSTEWMSCRKVRQVLDVSGGVTGLHDVTTEHRRLSWPIRNALTVKREWGVS